MKKLMAVLLTGVMLLAAGCGIAQKTTTTSSSPASSGSAAPAAPKSDFPNKAVTLVAHTAPGGGGDVFSRQVGKALQTVLGKPVVIENRSGGSGGIAMKYLSDAKPDGYTLLAITDTMIITPLSNVVPVDLSSSRPVSRMVLDAVVLYTKADSKWTADSLLDAIKNGKEKMKWGDSQAGTPEDMAMQNLITKYGSKINAVLFGDSTKALTSVLSGDTEASIGEMAEILPQLQANQLKVLLSLNSSRIPTLPDVPTFAEKGFPDLVVDKFRGFAAPKDTPDDVIKILEDAFKKVLDDPEYKKTYTGNNQIPAFLGSADFSKFITQRTADYKKAFGK